MLGKPKEGPQGSSQQGGVLAKGKNQAFRELKFVLFRSFLRSPGWEKSFERFCQAAPTLFQLTVYTQVEAQFTQGAIKA